MTRASASGPVLEIQALTVRYGARLATWSLDLALEAGEVLGLVGESGAGKSTVGPHENAMAMSTRWRIPPESSCG